MNKIKLKKGDEVMITLGKDRGRKGKIEKIDLKNGTVTVPGINIYKKTLKKSQQNPRGGVVDVARPLPLGKVSLICPKCKKVTRIGFQIIGNEKIRICRKCQQKI